MNMFEMKTKCREISKKPMRNRIDVKLTNDDVAQQLNNSILTESASRQWLSPADPTSVGNKYKQLNNFTKNGYWVVFLVSRIYNFSAYFPCLSEIERIYLIFPATSSPL